MDTEPGYTSTLRIPKPAAPSVAELAEAFPQMEILELIGQGGMGYVYKARQQRLDRIVALKILPEILATDPAFAERFSREGRLLAKLNHPNIVTVHDFGVTDPTVDAEQTNETVATAAPTGDSPAEAEPKTVTPTHRYYYLMMEYVDGANLRQAMRAGRFTPEQALNVVPKVCDALQYAHDEGVLHRDIKPENILVDTRGNVKIADFGIAKLVDAPEGKADVTLTGVGSTLGTPHYMAPEQIEQPSKVDHRADIYSLGVVFYEMLTGELPIGRFAPPSEKTSVNARVDEIVFRALEKEREMRQQSATQIKTEVMNAARAASTPSATRSPRSEVSKTAQCFFTMPEYLQTFKARFAHPFTSAGDLMLEKDQLIYETGDAEMIIPLSSIRDVSVGQLEWWSMKGNISIISITMEKDGLQRTFMFRPSGPWPEPVLQSNRHVVEWADTIRQAVAAVGGETRETPAESMPLPAAPRWILPACIATIFFGPMIGFFGAELIGAGEQHGQWIPMAIGTALLVADLTAVIYLLMACLTFTCTRWALGRGTLLAMTMPPTDAAPGGTKSGPGSVKVGTAVAFGAVFLYLGAALCIPIAAVFRLSENGLVGCLALVGALAVLVAVAIWEKGLPGRGWTRAGSVFAGLLALPTIPMAGFFLYSMSQERGGWNPATSEAVIVPLFFLGALLLPWAAVRLHRACRVFAVPVTEGAPRNPWPARIFWLLMLIFVLPACFFLLMLFVPYLAWQQTGRPASEMQVTLDNVSTSGNLVLVDVSLWTKDGRFSLTPRFTGVALPEDLKDATPAPKGVMVMYPTAVGQEPEVRNEFRITQIGENPSRCRVAFALRDPHAAEIAATGIHESFAGMQRGKPHVRQQLFLFHIKDDDQTETYASLDFAKAHRVLVVDEISFDAPSARTAAARARLEELDQQQETVMIKQVSKQRSIDMLGSLPVTLTVKDVKLMSVTADGEFDEPSVAVRPPTVLYSNQVVSVELEIKTSPGVPAIGFNYQGARLDFGFLDAIGRPIHHSKVTPEPGVSQMAFQLARGPHPETIFATTMLIPLPDQAAAKEVLQQLTRIKEKPLSRMVKRDREDKQLKLGFFNVLKSSQGAYQGWFVFAPPREQGKAPKPPGNEGEIRELVESPDAESVAMEKKLVGTWESNLPPLAKALLTFNEDGRFVTDVTLFTKNFTSMGTWRVEDGKLVTRVEESTNPKEIGKTEHVEIVSVSGAVLVTREVNDKGKVNLTTLRRVETPEVPMSIDRAYDTPTRRTFDLKHKLASKMQEELRQVLPPANLKKAQIDANNQRLTVFGPADELDRTQTFVAVMDWPTGIARRPNFEYSRDSVMDAMRSFFHACAIEDNYQVFNKMLSVSALNRLLVDEGLPVEALLDETKMDIFEKELRETDWDGKKEAIEKLVKEMNKYPLKSVRQEPGVAIGFGARYSVSAIFGRAEVQRTVKFSISVEKRKEKNSPIRYMIDNWEIVESGQEK